MNRCRLWLVLAWSAILAPGGHLRAQEAPSVAPPKEPFLRRAPERAEWTVEYRYDAKNAGEEFAKPKSNSPTTGEPPGEVPEARIFRPTQVRVSKDGKVYREVTTWTDGSKTEKWIVDGLQIREVPRSKQLARIDLTSYSENFSDYRRSDFEIAEWIKKENYTGPKIINGQVLYEFRSDPRKKALTPREQFLAGSMGTSAQEVLAYLDIKSQLPVFVVNGDKAYVFKDFAPGSPLVVPTNFAADFKKWKDRIAERTRPPTPP